jgi:hypothetical protein
MNIFAVDEDPIVAARMLPDKLVVKMPTESIQMLCPWAFKTHGVLITKPEEAEGDTYGTKGFAHHPCTLWQYEDPANVAWLLLHAFGLCAAYTERYGKNHGALPALFQLAQLFEEKHGLPSKMFKHHTPFPQAMPDEHKVEGDAVAAYRKYINCEKGYAVWNFSEKPSWWSEELHKPCRDEYLKQRELKKQLKAKDDPQPPSVPSALQSEREV